MAFPVDSTYPADHGSDTASSPPSRTKAQGKVITGERSNEQATGHTTLRDAEGKQRNSGKEMESNKTTTEPPSGTMRLHQSIQKHVVSQRVIGKRARGTADDMNLASIRGADSKEWGDGRKRRR